jgi:FdhD protein
MSDNIIQKSLLQHVNHKDTVSKQDCLAIEAPLEIRIGHDTKKEKFFTLAITLCSPADIEYLVTGYLFSEQMIKSNSDIVHIEIYKSEFGTIAEVKLDQSIEIQKFLHKRQSVMHSSCGVCGKTEFDELMIISYPEMKALAVEVSSDIITALPKKLNFKQKGFKQTGGIHASALFNLAGELIMVKEDIGRHNALDKLIGKAIIDDLLPLNNHIILLSGRVSFELVHKALMAGVSILAAIGAPSSLAVELANSNNLCLIGFVKNKSYNIYSCE